MPLFDSIAVASYIWSHTRAVLAGDDTSLLPIAPHLPPTILNAPDPVWYDPRRHSRYLTHTLHCSARTALTLSGDLIWGRSSPAPRTARLNLAILRDGIKYEVVEVGTHSWSQRRPLL